MKEKRKKYLSGLLFLWVCFLTGIAEAVHAHTHTHTHIAVSVPFSFTHMRVHRHMMSLLGGG